MESLRIRDVEISLLSQILCTRCTTSEASITPELIGELSVLENGYVHSLKISGTCCDSLFSFRPLSHRHLDPPAENHFRQPLRLLSEYLDAFGEMEDT
jgi:hypothetical protein